MAVRAQEGLQRYRPPSLSNTVNDRNAILVSFFTTETTHQQELNDVRSTSKFLLQFRDLSPHRADNRNEKRQQKMNPWCVLSLSLIFSETSCNISLIYCLAM